MDQKKIGNFLKDLRKEKSLTQEQVAEKLGVSSRTISRWETGAYMPDISMLVDIAEMYDVDVREIIDGERIKENMNSEVKEVAVKMADYSKMETDNIKKWVKTMSVSMLIVSILMVVMEVVSGFLTIRLQSIPLDTRFMIQTTIMRLIGPSSVMAYITIALSIMGIIVSTGKHRQLIHSKKARTLVKVVVVVAILLAIFMMAEMVIVGWTLYSLS